MLCARTGGCFGCSVMADPLPGRCVGAPSGLTMRRLRRINGIASNISGLSSPMLTHLRPSAGRAGSQVAVVGRDDRAAAGYRQHGMAVAGPGGHVDGSSREVVADGVVDQVGDKPFGQEGVAAQGGRLGSGPETQAAAGHLRAVGTQDRAGNGREVDVLGLVDAAFAAGQG
jgi:hypothetical protein